MRAGIFGGTFNPIHNGHLRLAQAVRQAFGLDQIFLIPAAIPPHKSPEALASPRDRLKMIQIAVDPIPGLGACAIEIQRNGPSYTIDTVQRLLRHPDMGRHAYTYIIGLDAFLEIHTWKSFKALLTALPFIVMARPLPPPNRKTNQMQSILSAYLKQFVSDTYHFDPHRKCYRHLVYQPVYPFDVTPLAISATDIRRAVKQNRDLTDLIPVAVDAYIRKKGLYQ